MNATLYIGLDAGGTKTALLAEADDGRPAQELTAGGANLQRSGLEATARALVALIREAMAAHPACTSVRICAGVAGAGRAHEQVMLATEIQRLLGDRAPDKLFVVPDGEIALEAAFEGAGGAILIVGTGSLVLARSTDRTIHRAGGWGYLIGDEGSGYAIGREGLRRVAHALDGGPVTALTELVGRELGITSSEVLIRRVYQEHLALQSVAPLVVRAAEVGDLACREIIMEQVGALARQVRWVVSGRDIPAQIALFGGLASAPYYRQALTTSLDDVLPGWSAEPARHEPVYGALLMARRGTR